MKIACLGWGSLIWDPRTLPIRLPWFSDGPLLPIEFARQSSGDRITLVIIRGVPEIRVLWALMSISELDIAKKELAEREGIKEDHIEKLIGYWSKDLQNPDPIARSIASWAMSKGLDVVVWTALGPNLRKDHKIPDVQEVIDFLTDLPHERMKYAEEYVRRAPRQVDTDYRRQIEKQLGWTPINKDSILG